MLRCVKWCSREGTGVFSPFWGLIAALIFNLGEMSIQKFGFINRVDNVNWPPYRDSKS